MFSHVMVGATNIEESRKLLDFNKMLEKKTT